MFYALWSPLCHTTVFENCLRVPSSPRRSSVVLLKVSVIVWLMAENCISFCHLKRKLTEAELSPLPWTWLLASAADFFLLFLILLLFFRHKLQNHHSLQIQNCSIQLKSIYSSPRDTQEIAKWIVLSTAISESSQRGRDKSVHETI